MAPESEKDASTSESRSSRKTSRPTAPPRNFFAVPTPIKQLFDRFPLLTYPSNELPLRAPALHRRSANILYIFATGAGDRELSFNPGCLKWQTYMTFCGVPFRVERSNNHASPSGTLPFLKPAEREDEVGGKKEVEYVTSAKLQRWCREECERSAKDGGEGKSRAGMGMGVVEEPGDFRYEAYLSLIDLRIRRAWLYTIYLSPTSLRTPSEPLYILPTSTNPLVRLSTASSLRTAASAEILKHSAVVNATHILAEAEEAFRALEMLLGDNDWFFGARRPGLFDAAVFAYTHLLLDDGFAGGWADTRLCDSVRGRRGLVAHRERVWRGYF
ncbi:hypothetical protein P280DRAFT_414997, partial [Massarina eburnea CBS 473.64]